MIVSEMLHKVIFSGEALFANSSAAFDFTWVLFVLRLVVHAFKMAISISLASKRR
jgi:hypothetical protein